MHVPDDPKPLTGEEEKRARGEWKYFHTVTSEAADGLFATIDTLRERVKQLEKRVENQQVIILDAGKVVGKLEKAEAEVARLQEALDFVFRCLCALDLNNGFGRAAMNTARKTIQDALAAGEETVNQQEPVSEQSSGEAEMNETTLSAYIRLAASKLGARLFRNQVGSYQLGDGRWVTSGLGVGSPDLIGWQTITITPEMVGSRVAVFVGVEVKKFKRQPSQKQKIWLLTIRAAGGIASVLRDADDVPSLFDPEKVQKRLTK